MIKLFRRGASFGAAISLLIVLFVTAGCGDREDYVFTGNQGTPIAGPGVAPTVTFVAPSNGATDVPVNTAILATFSQAMQATSLSPTTFLVTGPNSAPVAGVVTTTLTTATFRPSQPLTANTVYTATITTGALGQNGTALAAPFSWTFTTGAAPDVTAPTVTFTDPVNEETGVGTNRTVAVTFSEALDPATLNNQTFSLVGPGNAPVQGTISNVGLTAIFTPSAPLAANASYTATISSGPTDLAGNPLAAPFVWTFTTGDSPDDTAPTVSSVVPINEATDVPINSDLLVTFSEAMDPLSITNQTFTVTGPGATAVAGTVTYVGNTATFNPNAALAANTLFTATITTGAEDLAGNNLLADFVWTFTTGAAPDTTRPTVTTVSPVNGATESA